MRIGIQTWGSEGDARPFLALAAGLRSSGHDVTVAITHLENRDYAAVGDGLGVRTRKIGHLDPAVLKATGQRLITVTNPLKQVRIIAEDLFEPLARDMMQAAKDLCRENDLVIGHFLVHPLQTAADLAGVPRVSVFLAPLLPSGRFPPPGMPDLGRTANRLFWSIAEVVINRMFIPPINAMRRAEGLQNLRSVQRDSHLSRDLNLVGVSPTLFPPPADWDERVRLCGAFILPDTGLPGDLPEPLRRFLAAGTPPVYMTFGSMFAADPDSRATVQLLTDAARLAGCRAIIQCGPEGMGDFPEAKDVYPTGPAVHDRIFPHCAAIVHHGGSGTTQAASRAGCPSIVVQHATDQAFWGAVLHRAGIAPPVLDRRTVTAPFLARSIRTVMASLSMRERARAVGRSMQRENGVARAVELIEDRFGRQGRYC